MPLFFPVTLAHVLFGILFRALVHAVSTPNLGDCGDSTDFSGRRLVCLAAFTIRWLSICHGSHS